MVVLVSPGFSYRRLMVFLYHTEFEYNIPMDGNRCADGISLRYRFGYEHGIGDPVIASCLDNNPCSVLEMMVALALRCEEHIMLIPENGLMSGRWFWSMITNLGLDEMYDSNYDENMVNSVIGQPRIYTKLSVRPQVNGDLVSNAKIFE